MKKFSLSFIYIRNICNISECHVRPQTPSQSYYYLYISSNLWALLQYDVICRCVGMHSQVSWDIFDQWPQGEYT